MEAFPAARALRLFERVSRLRHFGDACLLVLDDAAAGAFARAVVVAGSAETRRVVGWGAGPEVLRALEERLAGRPQLLDGIAAGARPTLLPPGAEPVPEFEGTAAFTFEGASDRAFGTVLLEIGDAAADGAVIDSVCAAFRRLGGLLEALHRADFTDDRAGRFGRQRDMLTAVLNTLPDPVLITNSRNEIVLTNNRAESLLTPASSDSEGRRRAVQVNNLLLTSFLTQHVMSGPERGRRELNLVDAEEGSDLLFEVIAAPLPLGSETGSISVLRDITDLKRAVGELEVQYSRSRVAEHEARQERDRLNVMLENVGDPILVTDHHSNIILMNAEADRLFVAPIDGVAAAQRKLIQANDTRFTTLISDFLLRPEQRQVARLGVVDPDSKADVPAEVVSTKILNVRGEPVAIVSVIHDLTPLEENQRLARELQALNEQLEDRIRLATMELEERNRQLEWQSDELQKASRLKSEFLANMSHELRTPINVILGYTSLLRERIYGELTDRQDEALAKVYNTSQHLLELINDILDLSKIEAGKMPLHLEQVWITDVVAELSETILPMVAGRPLEYGTNVCEDLPAIYTDRTKVKQILLNLLSNAIKFTPRGEVRVSVAPAGKGSVRITVADTGIGIPADHLDTIFDDFRQIDQSHTREYGGTGLGLSITRKLLGLLQGSISVDSTYGEGTCFTIVLPSLPRPE
jgi:PAS domain S-box-containing protein